jgi:NAD(P)-dependent dehydrogenase (short-subunit alcohol dehydrogenase family)
MNKTALVTGGNRGLGLETCRQLAGRGYRVLLTSRDQALGEAAAAPLRQEGLAIDVHQLDVTVQEQVTQVYEFVLSEYGRLDVLVNNAGVYLDKATRVFEVAESIFEGTLAVNFYGAMRMTRTFIALMKEQDYGRVVNVSSGLGSLEAMGNAPGRDAAYRVSKAALNALTRLMASDVKDYNIKINAANPRWVKTRMGGSGAPRDVTEGVDTILWLATLPPNGPTGGFFQRSPTAPVVTPAPMVMPTPVVTPIPIVTRYKQKCRGWNLDPFQSK